MYAYCSFARRATQAWADNVGVLAAICIDSGNEVWQNILLNGANLLNRNDVKVPNCASQILNDVGFVELALSKNLDIERSDANSILVVGPVVGGRCGPASRVFPDNLGNIPRNGAIKVLLYPKDCTNK